MRIFPSITVSLVTGAVMLALCIAGMQFIVASLHPGVLRLLAQLLWGIATFFIPVVFSTMDMRRARERQRELGGDIFTPLASRQDLRELHVPAWIRMGALFFSTLISVVVLKWLGVHI